MSKQSGKSPINELEQNIYTRKTHLIFLVILQSIALYSSQSSAILSISLSSWTIIPHSLAILCIPLVLYTLLLNLLQKIRSFNFYLISHAALWSTSVLILHPTFAHRTLGIEQYQILWILLGSQYLLLDKQLLKVSSSTFQLIFFGGLAVLASLATHPFSNFVTSAVLCYWLLSYSQTEVSKVVHLLNAFFVVALLAIQHFQLLPSSAHIAPQCETLIDYFEHFIFYIISFGNKLIGFLLPINLFSRDYQTNLFITRKETAFEIANKLLQPYSFVQELVEYFVLAKESKHVPLNMQSKTNGKLSNPFMQDTGNLFFTELWVVFSLIVLVVALKTVITTLVIKKQKLQTCFNHKSILFCIALLLSFDTIHQSWQFDSKFLSLEDVYNSGFDGSVVLFTVQLGILFVDALFSMYYHVNGKDRDYDVVNAVNKTRTVVMIAKGKEGSDSFEALCPNQRNQFVKRVSQVLHTAAILAAFFLLSRTL